MTATLNTEIFRRNAITYSDLEGLIEQVVP